ncbi:efflux RND transporter periplasmic adaptor subunit [Bacteroidota bacterium]
MNSKIKSGLMAAVLIILGFIIFQIFSGMKKEPKPAKVYQSIKYARIDTVRYSNHTAEIVAYGRLKSYNKIEVYSEVGGIVMESSPKFKVGNSFASSMTMISVDDEEIRLNLYSQKSDFLNLLTRMLPDIKADFTDSYTTWKQYLDEFEIEGKIKKLPEPKSSKEKYFLAGRNIYKLYYAIRNIEVRISKYKIKAPFQGVVTQSLIETGTSVRMGQKLGEFAGSGSYELEVQLNKDEVKFINIGNIAKVISEDSDNKWIGRISRISEHVDPSTQTVKVFIIVSGQNLFDGMYLKVSIDGKIVENAYKLPRSAIVNNQYVHTLEDSLLAIENINVILLGESNAYIRGIDSLKVVISEPLVNTPIGAKVVPIKK